MGRHSAPDDADDVDVAVANARGPGGAAPSGGIAARAGRPVATPGSDEEAVTGRHLRITELPRRGAVPPERPVERTTVIAPAEAVLAAGEDAAGPAELPIPPAELEPILPGEAIVPPVATEHVAEQAVGQGVRKGVEPAPLVALESLLEPAAPGRRWGRPKPSPAAPPPAPPAAEPVVAPTVEHAPAEHEAVARPTVRQATERVAEQAPAPVRSEPRGGTAADFALLRKDPTLRARSVAGLLAPFAVYAVVLLVVGGHGVQWLLWIWIPTIVAGVVVGAFLDTAHKQNLERAGTSVSGS